MGLMSQRLFACSLRAGAMLLAVAMPILIAVAVDSGLDLGVREALFDWTARLWILLICVGYGLIRWQVRRRLQPS